MEGKKYCKHCGELIDVDCVVCPKCGKMVEEINTQSPQVVINNSNNNSNVNQNVNVAHGVGKPKNKWVALVLCIFLGFIGGHKFYEEKIGKGILYLFTMGLFGIGVIIDLIALIFKPNPYYV